MGHGHRRGPGGPVHRRQNPASRPGQLRGPVLHDRDHPRRLAANITVLAMWTPTAGRLHNHRPARIGLWKVSLRHRQNFFCRASPAKRRASTRTVAGYVGDRTTVLNHGWSPTPGYAAIGDVLMVSRTPIPALAGFSPPSWFAGLPAEQIRAWPVYGVPGAGSACGRLSPQAGRPTGSGRYVSPRGRRLFQLTCRPI